jgi:hypothetical protein
LRRRGRRRRKMLPKKKKIGDPFMPPSKTPTVKFIVGRYDTVR